MITFCYNNDLKILEVFYEGCICSEEILTYGKIITQSKDFPRELKVLIDARKANYNFTAETVKILTQIIRQNMRNYTFMKVAMLHAKPLETAYSMLIENDNHSKNYYHKVFNSKNAAITWLTVN